MRTDSQKSKKYKYLCISLLSYTVYMDFNEIINKGKELQGKFKSFQRDMAEEKIIGEASGGDVKVHVNGNKTMEKIEVSDDLWGAEKDIVGQFICSAANDAMNKVDELTKEKAKELTGGLPIPGDLFG